jgi:AcrR family transcriptional regulator
MLNKIEDIRIIKTKKALNKSLCQLLITVPYSQISIVEICNNADVHRATFYNYYKSKDDLFVNCVKQVNQNFIDKFYELNRRDFSSRSELLNYIIDSFIEKSHELLQYIKKVVAIQKEEKIYYILNKSIYECLYQVLSLVPSQGVNVSKDFIAKFYAGALTSISFWYIENDNISKEEFTKYVHHFLSDKDIDNI